MKMRDVMPPAPVSPAADESVSISDLALNKNQGSVLSDFSAAQPNI
jgi:hypothetical protein